MLFSDYFVLSFDLQGAKLLRCKRGFSMLGIPPEVLQKRALAIDPQASPNLGSEGYPWSASLSLAKSLIQQMPTKAVLNVVLSNQLVRYKVLPALPPMTSTDEAVNMAKQSFIDVFGDIVEKWRIVVNPLPHGESVLISAMDEALLFTLKDIADSFNIKLVSVQPYLMAGFNTLHRGIRAKHACFVQVEANRISIAMIREGSWESVSSQLAQESIEEQIIGLIKREMILVGWPAQVSPTIYLTLLNANSQFSAKRLAEVAGLQQWPVEWVKTALPKGTLPEQDHSYALAIAGVI